MAHRHGDGGASGAVYGSMAAAAVGGVIAIPIILLCGLFLRLCLQHWKVTLTLTLGYFAWFHPHDTWDTLVHLPEIVLDTWRFTVAPALGFAFDLLAELAATRPGLILIGLVGLAVIGNAMEIWRSDPGDWLDHI